MYTDYHAETYFLQDPQEMQLCIENGGVNTPKIGQGSAETSHVVLAMHAHPGSGSTANSLTPTPEAPAKQGDDK